MQYGEAVFDLLYLAFAIASGVKLLRRGRNVTEKRMGLAALILGCGDAFHLVPRVLKAFVPGAYTAALGLGRLVTSITMTAFYVLLYRIWLGRYGQEEDRGLTKAAAVLALTRVILCLFPQNGWLQNGSGMAWGILRNVPFVLLGALVCRLYWRTRRADRAFRHVWLYILLSFLFYIPVAVAAGTVPMLGMLMLPKTICYVLMLLAFLRAAPEKAPQ